MGRFRLRRMETPGVRFAQPTNSSALRRMPASVRKVFSKVVKNAFKLISSATVMISF